MKIRKQPDNIGFKIIFPFMEEKNITKVSQETTQSLIKDLRQIIDQACTHVAVTANYELTMMYWHIGDCINREVLGNQLAGYGKQIVSAVSSQLQAVYGHKGLPLSATLFFLA